MYPTLPPLYTPSQKPPLQGTARWPARLTAVGVAPGWEGGIIKGGVGGEGGGRRGNVYYGYLAQI